MKKTLLVACVCLLLTACASIQLSPVKPESSEVFDSYETGRIMTANVGEPILHFRLNIHVYPGFEAVQDFPLPKDPNTSPFIEMPVVEKGSQWAADKRAEDGGFACTHIPRPIKVLEAGGHHWNIGVLVNEAGEAYGTTRCIEDYHYKCNYSVYTNIWERPEKIFKPIKVAIDSAALGMEIIYTGRSKTGISFTYREWGQDDLEFNYDIDSSNVIGIKGMEFEIIEATNSYVRFTIRTPREKFMELMKERFETPIAPNTSI